LGLARMGVSRFTVANVEKGKPGTSAARLEDNI
jgi:DNA-binding XRE family transcriptional regulator